MPYNTYINSIPYYSNNMYQNDFRQFNPGPRPPRPRPPVNNRPFGGFALPFALGFLTAPLVSRPNYYYYPNYYRPPYYPFY